MEVMTGASSMDGEWESICRILSFDQDSHIPNSISDNGGESLLGLLMANSDSSTSQSEFGFPTFNPTSFSYNLSQFRSGSDLVSSMLNGNEYPSEYCLNEDEDDGQFSSLTINSDGNRWIKRKHDDLEIKAEALNKRIRTRGNRKTNNKINEEEQKWSSDTSENDESKGSHQLINKKNSKGRASTEPQSLYARKRRERINERLRILQSLVPNGTKVDLSTMLEEAVNYVKFLQLQIKSQKIAKDEAANMEWSLYGAKLVGNEAAREREHGLEATKGSESDYESSDNSVASYEAELSRVNERLSRKCMNDKENVARLMSLLDELSMPKPSAGTSEIW